MNRWDSALSFNAYTGNVSHGQIRMHPDVAPRLPAELSAFVTERDGWAVLDLFLTEKSGWFFPKSTHQYGCGEI